MYRVKIRVIGYAGSGVIAFEPIDTEGMPSSGIVLDDGCLIDKVTDQLIPSNLRLPNTLLWLHMLNPASGGRRSLVGATIGGFIPAPLKRYSLGGLEK